MMQSVLSLVNLHYLSESNNLVEDMLLVFVYKHRSMHMISIVWMWNFISIHKGVFCESLACLLIKILPKCFQV